MAVKEQNRTLAKKKLKFINQQLAEHKWRAEEMGLSYGKLGCSLYFFMSSKYTGTNDEKDFYLKKAEQLLEEIYGQLNAEQVQTGFFDGLAGIAYTINYLIQEKYVEGDVDDVLEEIDNAIFRKITDSSQLHVGFADGILGYIAYLIPRVKEGSITHTHEKEYMLKRLLIVLINELGTAIEEKRIRIEEPVLFDITWDLPICLMILAKVRKLNIYNTKIDKLLTCLSNIVTSLYPRLQSNRLNLLVGIEYILKEIKMKEWKTHSAVLRKNINLEYILIEELKDRNIQLGNGITGVYLLAKKYNQISNQNLSFQIDNDKLINRIIQSAYWDTNGINGVKLYSDKSLLLGLPGIGLLLSDMLKVEKS